MKLSFSTLACPHWSLPEVIGAAAAHGFAGIDLRGLGPEIDVTRHVRFDGELDSTLDLLRRHGLEMPCLNTSIALVTPAPERWQMMLDEGRRHALLAGRLGSRYLRIFGGAAPRGMMRAEAAGLARRHLRQLIRICRPQGCQVLLETHDAWSTGEEVMDLLGPFDPDEAGVLWDIEHPCRRGERPRQTAQAIRTHLRHLHFKDALHENGRYIPRLLGEGRLPLKETIQALREVGYEQWICLETEKRWHPETAPEPEESLPQFVRFMRANWGEDGKMFSH